MRFAFIAFWLAGVALVFVPFVSGATAMTALLRAPCGESAETPAAYKLAYEEVEIPSRAGGVYRGYYMPGKGERAAATIIVPPPYSAGRGTMLYEAGPLAAAGYNVLTYESRSCVGRALSLGWRDMEDIEDATDYLVERGGDLRFIGLHGFSSAGAASIMAAGGLSVFRGVVAEGGYHNLNEIMGMNRPASNPIEWLMMLGVRGAYLLNTGDDTSRLDPTRTLLFAPNYGVFLIYGERELTLAGGKAQLAVAREGGAEIAELWVVPGADHGGYISAVGLNEYMRRVTAFYDCTLLGQCEAWWSLWRR